MAFKRCFAGITVAAGILFVGASRADAQGAGYYHPYSAYPYPNRYQDQVRYGEYNSYDRREELQEHLAHDRARLDEAIRCGNDAEASRQAAELARDQRLLQEQTRAINAGAYYGYYNAPRHQRGWGFSFGLR
jgi:hypothetical protein